MYTERKGYCSRDTKVTSKKETYFQPQTEYQLIFTTLILKKECSETFKIKTVFQALTMKILDPDCENGYENKFEPFKRQPYKMVKHTQTIRRQIANEFFECI